jgi:parallel beta-helix repeat protein
MRKTAAVTLILICLLGLNAVYLHTAKAQYQGHITINADGTISPSSAPIVQNGNTYTLTSDVKGYISIRKSNITFNGNEHTIDQYAQSQNQGNAVGIGLDHVYNVTVANTTITNTGNGIYALQQPTAGIYVDYGGSNVIIGNNVVNNYNAMSFLESNNNIITQNNFTNNNNPYVIVEAVMFWGSSNNKIYQNNFIDNNRPAGTASFNSQSSGNIWDNGKEGNYWGDYNGTDADGDGIGDTPYEIYTKNKGGALYPKNTDRYPLIKPFNSTMYLHKTTPPRILVLSPVNQVFNESTVPLLFTVDKQVNWMGYSLNGRYNITVTGNITLPEFSSGSHNVTVYSRDVFDNMGASETIRFTIAEETELEPFPVVPVAIASVAAIAVVGVGLLFYLKKRKH